MDPYLPMHNSTTLLPWVRLLQLLRDANPQQAIDNAVRDVCAPLMRSFYSPPNNAHTGYYYGQLNAVCFLLLDGCSDAGQAILLTAGYLGPSAPAHTQPR